MKRATLVLVTLALLLACTNNASADFVTSVSFDREVAVINGLTGSVSASSLFIGNSIPASTTLSASSADGSISASYDFNSTSSLASFHIATSYSTVNLGSAHEFSPLGNAIPISFTTTQALSYTLAASQQVTQSSGNDPSLSEIGLIAVLNTDANNPSGGDVLFRFVDSSNTSIFVASSGVLSANTTYYFTADADGSASNNGSGFLSGNSDILLTLMPVSGSVQTNPLLPTTVDLAGNLVFSNVQSGLWFDPATAYGFDYQMTTPGSLYTKIDAFPTGFNGPFTISSGGVVLGTASAGQSFTFANGGVSEFEITGISPQIDPTNTSAFPLQLEFSSPTASFTMTPLSPSAVPEPASLTLLGIGAVCSLYYGWRWRKQAQA